MERVNVKSSTIKTIGYDSSILTMEVEFKNGCVYRYTDVPTGLADSLMGSESKGRFFHKEIRNNYKSSKIYDPKDEKKEEDV